MFHILDQIFLEKHPIIIWLQKKVKLNLIDTKDAEGQILHSTILAIADSIAAAANLVVNKNANAPIVIIRGYDYELNNNINQESLERPMKTDIFI